MKALATVNVTRRFFRKRGSANFFNAVDDVTLFLESGKITVMTGPSGSGKTTLLNIMAGILEPTSGTVRISDTDLYGMNDIDLSIFRNEHIGVIPQGGSAVYSLSVLDNVLLPYSLYKGKKRDKRSSCRESETGSFDAVKRAETLLSETGILELKNEMPSEISGGEMRRMAIARSMVMRPDVILADEPTADLDEKNTEIVLSLMRLAADEGSAVFIVTHDKDIFHLADKVLNLKEGRIVT